MSEQDIQLTTDAVVSLRKITNDNLDDILRLKVKPEQEKFVAGNAVSIAQAHFEDKAWFRAIYADETRLAFDALRRSGHERLFLVAFRDRPALSGDAFRRQALKQLIDYVRAVPGAQELLVSYVPEEGNPGPFARVWDLPRRAQSARRGERRETGTEDRHPAGAEAQA